MTNITHPVLTALALTLSLSCGQLACAQNKQSKDKSGSSAAAKATPEVQALTRFSNDGKAFMDSVRSARTAIFNGDPKTAKDLMSKAKASLQAAKKEAPSFNIKTTTSVQGKVVGTEQATAAAALVPVDGQMVITDDYMLTPEKQAHIDKANEHLKKGEAKEAAEELRLADIDVGFNRMWIPIASSEKHLDDAIKLASESKYYEANLALKAIEDSVSDDIVTLAEAPAK
jgi:hypothetical protein